MKIVLTTLPREGEYRAWTTPDKIQPKEVKYMPLGLVSLATNCGNHDVVILDPSSECWSIAETVEKINAECPDVVGYTVVTRRTYALYRLLEEVKCRCQIAGGPHCTYHAIELMERGVHSVFVGGMADEEFRQWLENPKSAIYECTTDINAIAFPDRTKIEYNSYFYSGKILFESKKRMSMFSSIGCPNRCMFCSVQTPRIKFKRSDIVVREMSYLKSIGAESIHIMDDNFNINQSHVSEIVAGLDEIGWNMEWSIRGQVRFDLSLVEPMKKLGLKRIHVGIESLDDDTLLWFGKKHRYSDIVKFCDVMKQNDIEVLAYFIVGTPSEDRLYIESLPDKIRELGIKQPYVNVLFPEPDTQYYQNLLSAGIYKKDIWAEYMKNPIPDFEIAAPFGEAKKQRACEDADRIIGEFSGL